MIDVPIHLPKRRVHTADITLGTFAEQVDAIIAFGAAHRSTYVCCVNAHMTVEARAPDFAQMVNEADLATPDGMPVLEGNAVFPPCRPEARGRK